MILEGKCRSVSIIADISCCFLFHFHAIRYAFYSIHPTYRAEGENERLTLSEMGVNLKQGYNGDLTSREAGSVGGQMVKKMIESYEKNL